MSEGAHEPATPAPAPAATAATAQATAPPTPTAAPGRRPVAALVVADGVPPPPGAMGRADFKVALQGALERMVDEELGPLGWSGRACPWIAHYVETWGDEPPEVAERMLARWLPPAAQWSTAAELLAAVVARARDGVRAWRERGELPTGVPGAPPAPPGDSRPVRFFGGRGAAAEPAAVLATLGPGRPLPSGVSGRFSPHLGPLDHVRVHDDPIAGRTARALGSRAFSVGSHVAFGAGQYRPGRVEGDLLLAHELAHATHGATSSETRDEQAADGAAVRVAGALWGGAEAEEPLPRPAGGGGLALRRCDLPEGASPETDVEETPSAPQEWTDTEMRASGFGLAATPHGPVPVGTRIELALTRPDYYTNPGSSLPGDMARWYVYAPGTTSAPPLSDVGTRATATLDREGTWTVQAAFQHAGRRGWLTMDVVVETAAARAQRDLAALPNASYTELRLRLELQALQLAQNAVPDQRVGDTWIELSGRNPARATRNWPDLPVNTYTVHHPTELAVARRQWIAVPAEDANPGISGGWPTESRYLQQRAQIEGQEGYDLGTGSSARWTIGDELGLIHIYCHLYDAAGTHVGLAAYRQALLTSREADALAQWRSYLGDVDQLTRAIPESRRVVLPAIHVDEVRGTANELFLVAGNAVPGGQVTLLDLTPGVNVRSFSGADLPAAIEAFNSGNSYPRGHIRLRVPQNSAGFATNDWKMTTTGASTAESLAAGWGWASLGLAGLGVISLLIPGAQAAAPVFFMAAAGVGAASAGASLYQHLREVHPSALSVTIDLVSLASSILGAAAAFRVATMGSRVAAVSKTGRFILWTGFASDAFGGVLLSVDACRQISSVLDGPGTTEQRLAAVLRIVAGVAVNGALLAWGARDLGATRSGLRTALGDARANALPHPDVHALGVLDAKLFPSLAAASDAELSNLARVIREDPMLAEALARRYGGDFVTAGRAAGSLQEVGDALAHGTPTLAGTRGEYFAPGAHGTAEPAYVMAPTNQSSPAALWREIRDRIVGTSAGGGPRYSGGAWLEYTGPALSGAPSASHTQYTLVIPAAAGGAEVRVPVSIASTDVLPAQINVAGAPTSPHGAMTGPATMEVTFTPGGGYRARIQVHQQLRKGDVRYAVGHELDELAMLVQGRYTGAGLTTQTEAAILRRHAAGGAAPAPTVHDVAAANELKRWSDPPRTIPATGALPEDVLGRMRALGLDDATFLQEKIALLRRQGVREDLLQRIEIHTWGVRHRGRNVGSLFDDILLEHVLQPSRGGTTSPISGGHYDPNLRRFNDPRIAIVLADTQTVNGVTIRKYHQLVPDSPTVPATKPPVDTPLPVVGGSPVAPAGWRIAPEPKTTFSDPERFLQMAEDAFRAWGAIPANKPTLTAVTPNQIWQQPVAGTTLAVGGYFKVEGTPPNTTPSMISIFPRW